MSQRRNILTSNLETSTKLSMQQNLNIFFPSNKSLFEMSITQNLKQKTVIHMRSHRGFHFGFYLISNFHRCFWCRWLRWLWWHYRDGFICTSGRKGVIKTTPISNQLLEGFREYLHLYMCTIVIHNICIYMNLKGVMGYVIQECLGRPWHDSNLLSLYNVLRQESLKQAGGSYGVQSRHRR